MPILPLFSPWHRDAAPILVRIRFEALLAALQPRAAPHGVSGWPSSGSFASREPGKSSPSRKLQRAYSRTGVLCADSERMAVYAPTDLFPWRCRLQKLDRTSSAE